jgi:phage tail-like protein
MANPAFETVRYPFTAFNFSIEITREGQASPLCSAAFSDCDGLEMTADVKTIREGGANWRQVRLSGPVTYGQLTLKRGMTANFDLWDWFSAVVADPSVRASAEVVLLAADGSERARFVLDRCVPVKLKAPALNAKDGAVAIEELQLAYESLVHKPPSGGGAGLSVGASVGVGF